MKFFSSLQRSVLLLGGIGVIACLVLVAEQHTTQRSLGAHAEAALAGQTLVADILPPPMFLIEMRLLASQVLEGSITPAAAEAKLEQLADEYNQRVAYWRAHPEGELTEQLLGPQHESAQQFMAAVKTGIIAPMARGEIDAARSALPAVHQQFLVHLDQVSKTVEMGNRFAANSMAEFEHTQTSSVRTAAIAAVLAITLVVLIYRVTLRSILDPVAECMASSERIATGDLTSTITAGERQDELGRLQLAMARMQGFLTELVSEVRAAAQNIRGATSDIADGNTDLSDRTSRQAASLEETASAMEQLSAAVRQNAEHAREANQLATDARHAAEQGRDVVSKAVSAMSQINESSQRMTSIVSVIDELAFQTNLLALNAAVEAARAGEQGRGFAVVAAEVRNLAQRSAASAKEIKALIAEAGRRVEDGSVLVNQSGDTLSEIVKRIQRVNDIVVEITAASGEQSDGIEQVNQAIAQMDSVTQQNAALVEESASASKALEQQVITMTALVERFRLQHHGVAAWDTDYRPEAAPATPVAEWREASSAAA